MKTVIDFHIRKPFFMTAGDKLNWPAWYSRPGIGLEYNRLRGDLNRIVRITDSKKRVLEQDLQVLYDFHKEMNEKSVMIIKGKKIAIFPRSIFNAKN